MNEEVLHRKGSPDFVGFPCGTCSIHIRFQYVRACTHCILLIERDTGVKQPSCVVRACHGDGCHVFSGLEVEGISVSEKRASHHLQQWLHRSCQESQRCCLRIVTAAVETRVPIGVAHIVTHLQPAHPVEFQKKGAPAFDLQARLEFYASQDGTQRLVDEVLQDPSYRFSH